MQASIPVNNPYTLNRNLLKDTNNTQHIVKQDSSKIGDSMNIYKD